MKNKKWLSGFVGWYNVVVRELQWPTSALRSGHSAFALAAVACLSLATPSMAIDPVDWELAINLTPARPTIEDNIHVLLNGRDLPDCTQLVFSPPQVDGFVIQIKGQRMGPVFECVPRRWDDDFLLPRLGEPGDYRLEVFDGNQKIATYHFGVTLPIRILTFQYLVVTLRLTDPRVGPARDASAVQLTPESGYFWFFSPDNIEVPVKLLDGRSVNGHYWLFLSGMTDLGLTVTVTNHQSCAPPDCPTKTYTNLPGKRLNIIDTSLF